MNSLRIFFIRLSSFAWTAFALVTICLALLVGVANLLLPYADRLTPQVEQWLTEQTGRPVSVDHIRAEWAAFGPRLNVAGLSIGDPSDPDRLEVANANFGLDMFSWIRPGRVGFQQFRLKVDQIELVHSGHARWRLGGFGGPGDSVRRAGNPLRWLSDLSLFALRFDRLTLLDESTDSRIFLPGGEVRFDNHGDHQHIVGRLGGGLSGAVEFTAEYHPASQHTRVYVSTEDLPLHRWFEDSWAGLRINGGELSFRMWGELGPDSRDWRGDVQLAEFDMTRESGDRVQGTYRLASLRSDFEAWTASGSHGIRATDLQVSRSGRAWRSAETAIAAGTHRYRVISDRLQIEDVLDALVLVPGLPDTLSKRLAGASPSGTLRDVDLALDRSGEVPKGSGKAELVGISWLRSGLLPGLRGLNGHLAVRTDEAKLRLRSPDLSLDFGDLFAAPFRGVGMDGLLTLRFGAPSITLGMERIHVSHGNVGADLSGRIIPNSGRPFVDLGLRLTDGAVADASPYWPTGKLKEPLVRWLNRALVDGSIDRGGMLLYGDLDDWPFRANEGRFEARAEVSEAVFDFREQWPPIENLSTVLSFDPFGLSATVEAGRIRNVLIDTATVELPRFRAPLLTARIEGHGQGDALLGFLRETPLQDDYGRYTEGLSIAGQGDFDLTLDLPLKKALGETAATGRVRFHDSRVEDAKWNIAFDATSGELEFTEKGFEASRMDTVFRENPAELTVRAGSFVTDSDNAMEAILRATSNPDILLTDFAMLQPLGQFIEGASPWTARITIPRSGGEARFALTSELGPADLALPPPLHQPPDTELPVSVAFDLGEPMETLEVSVGEIVALDARQVGTAGAWSAALHLGPGKTAANGRPGLWIAGSMQRFDLDAWLDVAETWQSMVPTFSGGSPSEIQGADVEIAELRLAGREFHDLTLRAYQQDAYWFMDVDGPEVLGRFRLPSDLDENRLMLAEFERFYWPESETELEQSHTDPSKLPPMDFYAADMRFGTADLGNVRFESFPTEYGMRIETFETRAPEFEVKASGDWLALGRSDFDVTLTAEDLGRTLERFGFAGMVDDGQMIATLHASWPGAPQDFEMSNLSGNFELSVGKGQIQEVNPGAGRIFGLLSLQTLPRRLQLDFSDLFKSGLAFDSITGDFELNKGEAFTRNTLVKGPTADVHIQGQTDLAEQRYDQIITVVPKVGGALPLVGAIAGGGVGAAAVMVLQNVFSDQIDKMTRYHYAVTGPWSEPDIELIGANESQLQVERFQPDASKGG